MAWWEWAAAEPEATNPVADATGEDCMRNQPGDVWFLAGTFGGAAERTCQVPHGRELFYPILNWLCEPGDGCESILDDAKVSATLDGAPVTPFYAVGRGTITAKVSNPVTGSAGTLEVISAGWWVRLADLPAGRHDLHFSGESRDGFALAVTYHVDVA